MRKRGRGRKKKGRKRKAEKTRPERGRINCMDDGEEEAEGGLTSK